MRTTILSLAISALAITAAESQAKDFWIKTKGSDCQVWSDEPFKNNDVISWTGQCKMDKADGKGKLTWTSAGKQAGSYEGYLQGGKLNGPGKLTLTTKNGPVTIEGYFKDGDVDGAGRFTDKAGNIYEGEVKDGNPHGTGYQKLGDEEYLGTFEKGVRQGVGWLLGAYTAYLGEFVNGNAAGSGMLEDAEGGRYHGQFKDNMPDGYGTYVSKDGAVYQGRFSKGKADGQLMVVTKNGGKPEIKAWKNGKKVK